ncbi:hypothetical protein EJ04DRAFT_228042 [Polyplosphaeria fusca]|uniref:Uncharacterized protein n=1 Tax=Polyplosphaeria fusca TaxID=682080 RepID=A0A9P4R0N5_9PLEO|nr:hypothetical protein EJ04DRAFT_228042 [Polyplosphaeria fusca]
MPSFARSCVNRHGLVGSQPLSISLFAFFCPTDEPVVILAQGPFRIVAYNFVHASTFGKLRLATTWDWLTSTTEDPACLTRVQC